MEEIGFAFILAIKNGGMLGFREAMEAFRAMDYPDMSVHVLDGSDEHDVEGFVRSVAGGDARFIYHRMQPSMGMSALWNQGIRYAKEEYLVFIGPMVRPDDIMPYVLADRIRSMALPQIIYSDYDELSEDVRINPQFLPDFNLELMRHTNYIGDTFCVRRQAFRIVGLFSEKLTFSFSYDFFLRAKEAGLQITHVPALLWHRRVVDSGLSGRVLRRELRRTLMEHIKALAAHFARLGIKADMEPNDSLAYIDIAYDGTGYRNAHKDYLLVHDKEIKVWGRSAPEILYGHIRQKDVAIVGCRFQSRGRLIDNCGYIYDKSGMIYPACYGQKKSDTGLYGRIAIAQDVSMVDPGYCMIDARFFRKSGGFDRGLTGREMMLDLCLRAREAGLRVVYEPAVTVKCGLREQKSTQEAHEALLMRWAAVVSDGDPYYSPNLPMGLSSNYTL